MSKKIILTLLIALAFTQVRAQKILDEVAAEVGNEIILKSDIEAQLLPYKDLPAAKQEQARCVTLDQLMQKKLLLCRARIDSLKINDEQVENELNRRMDYFVKVYGSEEKIEAFYHKSISEIKSDFREAVKEQLLEEQMQNKVVSDAEATPEQIKKFYDAIPKDSLPYFNTELEIGQIIIYPKASRADQDAVKKKLEQMRSDILSGKKSFCVLAVANSNDLGSALHCGELGMQRADNFVPEFAAAALLLKKDEISPVVQTKFGYHIIQMIDRKGEQINVRHILLSAQVGQGALDDAKRLLDSIKRVSDASPKKDSVFSSMAYRYDEDQDTKNRGGMMVDPKTNSSRIPVDQMDAVTFDAIDKLNVGDISAPKYYKSPEGREGYRILYLKSKNAPHRGNLKDDYPRIKQMAQEDMKAKQLDKWLKKYIPSTYIHIQPSYDNCKNLAKWHNGVVTSLGK